LSDGKLVPVVVQTTHIEGSRRRDGGSGHFGALVTDATSLVETEQDFQKLAGGLLNLYDEERRRIARELHDTTAQNLAALSMNLTMLGGAMKDVGRASAILKECEALTDACLKEVRSLSYMLHPPLLDELGLETALRAFTSLFERRTGIAVDLILSGQIGGLAPEVELAAFRIVQESLFNVQRHSGSRKAEVRLARRDGDFEVSVRDWGTGLAPNANLSGVGVAGMRERVRLRGGHLEIGPVDPGTLVRAKFPME
jgi:two-component system NarL family sensor kinase